MDEVLAAAERLRLWVGSGCGYPRDDQRVIDLYKVADAALAAGLWQADDGDEITAEWLVSVGGMADDHQAKVTFAREDAIPIGVWSVDDGWKVVLIIERFASFNIVRGLNTRGQLRQLLKAIGGGDGK